MALEGQQLGRYQIVRLLGSGGMGDVYLAEDPRIGQQVAIKVIRAEPTPYTNAEHAQDANRLFEREARAIGKLDHPSILPLYDYGEEPQGKTNLIYLVMPYRPEGSLVDWVRQHYPDRLVQPSLVAHLVSQAADALQHAHQHQIIHQDVKPSNFLLRANPKAPERPDLLLSDFGIARIISATASTSQAIRGTPTYMAPEQCLGKPVKASDQYSLAVMAYELLTGRPPFRGNQMQIMFQHVHQPPEPPSALNPRLSPEIDAALLYALAKDPGERFASVTAFANAFQQAATHLELADASTFVPAAPLSQVAPGTPAGKTPVLTPPLTPSASPEQLSIDEAATRLTPALDERLSATLLPAPAIEETPTRISSQHSEATAQPTLVAPGTPPTALPGFAVETDPNTVVPPRHLLSATGPAVASASAAAPAGNMPIVPPAPVGLKPPTSLPAARRRKRSSLLALIAAALVLALVIGGIAYAALGSGLLVALVTPHPSAGGHSTSTVAPTGAGTPIGTKFPTGTPGTPLATPNPSITPGNGAATSATVVITPASQYLSNTFTITAVLGTPNPSQQQVAARQISAQTQAYSQTVPATGQSTTQGTQATGLIDITCTLSAPITISAGTAYFNKNGTGPAIHLVFDQTVTLPGDGQYHYIQHIPGHVQEYGTIGNIPSSNGASPTVFQYNDPTHNFQIYNDGAYSGGQNGQTITVVQQSDVDNAANSLIAANQPTTQQAQQLLQGQVKANERAIGTPQCTPNTTSNPAVGAAASQVTVSVTFTCTGEVYDHDGALTMSAQLLTNQAANSPGAGYGLVGTIKTALTNASLGGQGTVTITTNAQGVWAYQFSGAQQLALAQLIAGQTKQNAQNLLASQTGVAQVNTIQLTGGNGQILPSDPARITISVQSVPGA